MKSWYHSHHLDCGVQVTGLAEIYDSVRHIDLLVMKYFISCDRGVISNKFTSFTVLIVSPVVNGWPNHCSLVVGTESVEGSDGTEGGVSEEPTT